MRYSVDQRSCTSVVSLQPHQVHEQYGSGLSKGPWECVKCIVRGHGRLLMAPGRHAICMLDVLAMGYMWFICCQHAKCGQNVQTRVHMHPPTVEPPTSGSTHRPIASPRPHFTSYTVRAAIINPSSFRVTDMAVIATRPLILS